MKNWGFIQSKMKSMIVATIQPNIGHHTGIRSKVHQLHKITK